MKTALGPRLRVLPVIEVIGLRREPKALPVQNGTARTAHEALIGP